MDKVQRKWISRKSLLLFACIFFAGASVMNAESPAVPEEEVLEYRWSLSGFKGLVARIFVPGTGRGTLTTGAHQSGTQSGTLVSELHISAPAANKRDYWLYGSEIDPEKRRTVRAWSAHHFRGKSRQKDSILEGDAAVDLASSIFFLRRELPEEETRTQIWSSGRLYDVAVSPGGRDARLVNGRAVRTRSYSLRGVGEPKWRGRLDLVLAEDEAATPLEITVFRDGMRVRLELEAPNFPAPE